MTSGVTPAHLAVLVQVVAPGIRLGWDLAPRGISVIPGSGQPVPAFCQLLLGAPRLQPAIFLLLQA